MKILDPFWTSNSTDSTSASIPGTRKALLNVLWKSCIICISLPLCRAPPSPQLAASLSSFLEGLPELTRQRKALVGCSHGLTGFHLLQTASRGREGEAGSSTLLARTARACTGEQHAQPGLAENPGAAAGQVCCPWVIRPLTAKEMKQIDFLFFKIVLKY